MRTRNNEIKIRFTDKELAVLDAKVAKTHLSREAFIRCVLAEEDIYVRPDPGSQELIKQGSLRQRPDGRWEYRVSDNPFTYPDIWRG